MALDYGMTNQEFEEFLDQVIDEQFVENALQNFGLLPKENYQLKNIKINTNTSVKSEYDTHIKGAVIENIKIDDNQQNDLSIFSIRSMNKVSSKGALKEDNIHIPSAA